MNIHVQYVCFWVIMTIALILSVYLPIKTPWFVATGGFAFFIYAMTMWGIFCLVRYLCR